MDFLILTIGYRPNVITNEYYFPVYFLTAFLYAMAEGFMSYVCLQCSASQPACTGMSHWQEHQFIQVVTGAA